MIGLDVRKVPNLLTLIRLLLCPLFIYLFLGSLEWLALVVFIVAVATDFLDGFSARKLGAVSALGRILDPVSDKIYLLGTYSVLTIRGSCPSWFLALLFTVNLVQCSGFLYLMLPRFKSRSPLGPTTLGKWNVTVQFAWGGYLLLLLAVSPTSALLGGSFYAIFCGLALLQISSFFQYFQKYRPLLIPDLRIFSPAQ